MSSASVRRRPLGRDAPSLDLSDTNTPGDTPRHLATGIERFLRLNSNIKRTRDCGNANFPCGSRLCLRCGRREASSAIDRATRAAKPFRRARMVTLTIEDGPSLAHQWDVVTSMLRTLGIRWLNERADAWAWRIEVTRNDYAGTWHVHVHVALIGSSDSRIGQAATALVDRWLELADEHDIRAERVAQDIQIWTPDGAIKYTLKAVLGEHQSDTYGRSFREIAEGYAAGDADDADLWEEIERALGPGQRRVWRNSRGLMPRRPVEQANARAEPRLDPKRLHALRLISLVFDDLSKARQARELGVGTATIARRRNDIAKGVLDRHERRMEFLPENKRAALPQAPEDHRVDHAYWQEVHLNRRGLKLVLQRKTTTETGA